MLFVGEQFETVIFEGIPARLRNLRLRIKTILGRTVARTRVGMLRDLVWTVRLATIFMILLAVSLVFREVGSLVTAIIIAVSKIAGCGGDTVT